MKKFETENWIRKSQFDFFKAYEDPFFNITSNKKFPLLFRNSSGPHLFKILYSTPREWQKPRGKRLFTFRI